MIFIFWCKDCTLYKYLSTQQIVALCGLGIDDLLSTICSPAPVCVRARRYWIQNLNSQIQLCQWFDSTFPRPSQPILYPIWPRPFTNRNRRLKTYINHLTFHYVDLVIENTNLAVKEKNDHLQTPIRSVSVFLWTVRMVIIMMIIMARIIMMIIITGYRWNMEWNDTYLRTTGVRTQMRMPSFMQWLLLLHHHLY